MKTTVTILAGTTEYLLIPNEIANNNLKSYEDEFDKPLMIRDRVIPQPIKEVLYNYNGTNTLDEVGMSYFYQFPIECLSQYLRTSINTFTNEFPGHDDDDYFDHMPSLFNQIIQGITYVEDERERSLYISELDDLISGYDHKDDDEWEQVKDSYQFKVPMDSYEWVSELYDILFNNKYTL